MAQLEVLNKQNNLWEISVEGEKKTALATGLPPRIFQGSDMSRLKQDKGYLWVPGTNAVEWVVEGMSEWENQLIFWGKDVEARPINQDEPFSAEELAGLTEIFFPIRDEGKETSFSLDGYFRTSRGGLFCFPSALMAFLHSAESEESLNKRELYNHPDRKGEGRLSHILALLTFQSATGTLPYTQNDSYEAIHEEMRRKILPSLEQNGMDNEELARAVSQGLNEKNPVPLEDWNRLFLTSPELSGTMTAPFKSQFEKAETAFVKSFRQRKNKGRNIFFAILAAALLYGAFTLLQNYLAPPYTADMTPREVVEAYFGGMNDLDPVVIDGTTEKKAGKFISDQVSTLFVISQAQKGYSMGGTISPEEWMKQGYPPLEEGVSLYGVSDLTIEELDDNRFYTSYLIWYPPTEDATKPGGHLEPFDVYQKQEILTLIRDKRDRAWIIGHFEEIEMVHIPAESFLSP
ncbi:MAG: hypothetical protein PQJ59_08610 [Spirochaetales bacterium]|nr:hypothetical protein [Spirochaetales bacterium]